MHCPECGKITRIEDQKYCEECGASLPSKEKIVKEGVESNRASIPFQPRPQQVSTTFEEPSVRASGGIFDINRNYYIIKEKMWDLGYGDILDENGTLIGKMNRKIFSIRRRVEIQELNGEVAATLEEKIVTARNAQDMKDPQGNLIARIKKKILTLFHPKFFLEDPFGNRWYEAEGDFFGWSFRISDCSTGKLIAEIEKVDRWRDVFLRGLFDFKDTYALRILDNETDRRILLGFVLSIDNVMHDNHGSSLGFIGGFGRYRRPGSGPFRSPIGRFPRRPF
ncbi:MAG: LURP-one-related family protein [Candidatus Lokiarchaeota archaeon]|nr:LURP-one-related family protein [Candidatus Lokiarchaeota archaeon]